MGAKLVAEEGNIRGLVLSLEEFEEGAEVVVGRDPDSCQLLIEDPVVSRRHLLCHVTSEGIVLENLSSTNPIQINQDELKDRRLLQHGDTVKIGGTTFRYFEETTAHLFDGQTETPKKSEEKEFLPSEKDEDAEEEEPTEELYEKEAPSEAEEHTTPDLVDEDEYEEKTRVRRDTIFEEIDDEEEELLAEIDFGILETGRWLLKVINGPNNGAEFSMQSGKSYTIGTDPAACDIIFHDTSVSRKHVKVSVLGEETLTIEDLGSRNGTHVDGERCEKQQHLKPNSVVTVGTTSFVVFDREGEMQTIIAPLLPSIVKVLQKEKREEPAAPAKPVTKQTKKKSEEEKVAVQKEKKKEQSRNLSAFITIAIVTGLFIVAAIFTTTLFQSSPVEVKEAQNSEGRLAEALASFPSVQYSYNKSTGTLFMVGHVLTDTAKKQLLYNLQGLTFIKSIDDSGIVIDEYVWQELNPLLAKNPNWRSVSVQAPSPGNFVLTGYLKNRQQMESLSEYISSNFPYLDLLDNRVVVEEEVIANIQNALQNQGMRNIEVTMSNGDITLRGGIAKSQQNDFNALFKEFKAIPGIRRIQESVTEVAPEKSLIDVSDRYAVSGVSSRGGALSVVVDGRIITKGDQLDGMTITSITPESIFLEKEGVKYRITIR